MKPYYNNKYIKLIGDIYTKTISSRTFLERLVKGNLCFFNENKYNSFYNTFSSMIDGMIKDNLIIISPATFNDDIHKIQITSCGRDLLKVMESFDRL